MLEILPGKSIGQFKIGDSFKETKKKLKDSKLNYKVKYNGVEYPFFPSKHDSVRIEANSLSFRFEKQKLIHIATCSQQYLFAGVIKVGDTLKDVEEKFGEWYDVEDDYVYMIKGVDRMCFDTDIIGDEESDEYMEELETILWISVF